MPHKMSSDRPNLDTTFWRPDLREGRRASRQRDAMPN